MNIQHLISFKKYKVKNTKYFVKTEFFNIFQLPVFL